MRASARSASWLAAGPVTVAIEIASHRVAVVGVDGRGRTIRHAAVEPIPDGAVVPSLAAPNLPGRDAVASALGQALTRAGLGGTRRAAVLVPDGMARVSLLPLESVPPRTSDLDQIVRWRLRKVTPFPLEQAQITYALMRRPPDVMIAAVVARRDVVAEYEHVVATQGIQAGIVDVASFNVMNAIMAIDPAASGDVLVVHRGLDGTTLAILRGSSLMFYRYRAAAEPESLGALVHQTAMYHEDRLGGAAFSRVWLSGGGADAEAAREIAARLGVAVSAVDPRAALPFSEEVAITPALLDAVAAPAGLLLRDRVAA